MTVKDGMINMSRAMKKLWITLIAFLMSVYCFSGCVHEDDYGIHSDASTTTQSPSDESEEVSSIESDTQSSSEENSDFTLEDSDSQIGSEDSESNSEESTGESSKPDLDIVPPITNGGNFNGTV